MALKFKLKSKDEIPAEFQSLYVERDGAFVLDVDGVADKSKLDEFRTNNVALLKQLDDLKKKFEGIDPEKVREIEGEKRKLEEAQALKNGEIEKLVTGRVQAVKAELEKQLGVLTAERDNLNSRLAEIQINQGVILAATKRRLRPKAIPDATLRARSIFKLEGGCLALMRQTARPSVMAGTV